MPKNVLQTRSAVACECRTVQEPLPYGRGLDRGSSNTLSGFPKNRLDNSAYFPSSNEKADRVLARRVYIFASLVESLPIVVAALLGGARYSTRLAAESATPGWGTWGVLALSLWSCVVSYRGVLTLFKVVRWKARIWFLGMPIFVYGSLVAGAFLLIATLRLELFHLGLQFATLLDLPLLQWFRTSV